MSGKRIVMTGATGMVGGEALALALEHPAVSVVTTVGRRPTEVDHPKLRQVVHEDFRDCGPIAGDLTGQDAALFCLGAYTGAVPDEEFRKITVDYAIGFAEAVREVSPAASFCLLSGAGADSREKSRVSFARYKGIAENALLRMEFPAIHIFRPGYIYPVRARSEPNLSYRVMRSLWPFVRRIAPNFGIDSTDLAAAMLQAALDGTPGFDQPILENRDICRLAEAG